MESDLGQHQAKQPSVLSRYATSKNRWIALVFICLGLAIVVIDNTILNVSVPYILHDLNAPFSDVQWAISGYALTIATVLIPLGRVGDMVGRKKIFLIGIIIFAIGSMLASVATDTFTLIFGRAIIQAVGAAITLTSVLAIIATEFQGRDRAIAFGIWGAIIGASATIGPLLGGYLTTFFSWRWSLRINLFIAIVAILGSIFIRESKTPQKKRFDWPGTILIGLGLFSLVYAFIQGKQFGWIRSTQPLTIFGLTWPSRTVSVIPFLFLGSALLLIGFGFWERTLERKGGDPLLKISLFRNRGFSIGLLALLFISFSLFGVFFTLPIYIENVLGYSALTTGIALLSMTITLFVVASFTGFLSTTIKIKWIVVMGLFMLAVGTFLLIPSVTQHATGWTLAPALVVFGIGFGLSSAQLNNMVISSAPLSVASESSATSITMRQIGFSISIAVVGTLLASALISDVTSTIIADPAIPDAAKVTIISKLQTIDIESGNLSLNASIPSGVYAAVKQDLEKSLTEATQSSILSVSFFTVGVAILGFFLPGTIKEQYTKGPSEGEQTKKEEREQVMLSRVE